MKRRFERVVANPRIERATTLLRAVSHEVRAERLTFMAGSIAYNAFVSLLPLLLLLMSVVSTVGNDRLRATLLGITEAVLTTKASEVLVREVRTASTEVSLIGVVLLVWGSLRIFRSLDAAFSDIYETSGRNTFVNRMADGVVVLVSMSAVVLVAVVLDSQLALPAGTSVAWASSRLVLVVGVAVALYPMYYLFPDETDIEPLEVVPGVVFTAVGLVVFQSLFQLYLALPGTAGDDSILANILVFLTWLYFTGLIVLVGAAVNAILSNRSQDVNVRPVLGGISYDEGWATADWEPAEGTTAEDLERLADSLKDADEVAVVVDDERVRLPPPQRVDADLDTSELPFMADTVGIGLAWAGENFAAEEDDSDE